MTKIDVLRLRHRDGAWQAAAEALFDASVLHRRLAELSEGLDEQTPYIAASRDAREVVEECIAIHVSGCRELLETMRAARPDLASSLALRYESWWPEEYAQRLPR